MAWSDWYTGLRARFDEFRRISARPKPAAEPAPAPPPAPIDGVPDSTWPKADIITWLRTAGVDITEKAATQLTKDELLALVDDVLSPATPGG